MSEIKKHWLVTGGAGFIGHKLVHALSSDGHSVTVFDNLSTGDIASLPTKATLVNASISQTASLGQCIENCDGVFHLAARVSVPECTNHWLEGHQDNLVGSINVFEAAASRGVPVVYASSAAVYGNYENPCHEALKELPISPYGADKLACEHQARAFGHIRGLSSIGLRFFNVYGPGQNPLSPYAGVISRFIHNALNGQHHVLFGDGSQTRDFVHVDDIVLSLKTAMDIQIASHTSMTEICNICSGRAVTLLELIDIIHSDLAAPSLTFEPARAGDIRHSVGDTREMKNILNFTPEIEIEDGICRLLKTVVN